MKSRGLGDDVAKITHFFKIDILVDKITKLIGKEDCGCKRRQSKLNKWFPYKDK